MCPAFKSEREAQAHMDPGKHVKELESVLLYDTIRLRWAERVTGISNVAQENLLNRKQKLAAWDGHLKLPRKDPI